MSENDTRMAWQLARDEAHLAFRLWCDAPRERKREAYHAYRAAADREETAETALFEI
jgi:hypothetical protein